MMEFVVSRAVLCMAGAMLLIVATGVTSAAYDTDVDVVDEELTERVAAMLDAFESSKMDVLILYGSDIIPDGHFLHVHDNMVEMFSEESMHTASTKYGGEFRLDFTDVVEITRRTSPLSS